MPILRLNRLFSLKFMLLAIITISTLITSAAPLTIAQDKPGTMTIKVDTTRTGFNKGTAASLQAMASLTTPIVLKVEDIKADGLSAALSSQTGCEVSIKPVHPDDIIITVDIANVAMLDVLRFLADNYQDAEILVNGYDFRGLEIERKALYSSKTVVFSINVVDVPLKQVVQLMRLLSLREIKLDAADEQKRVTISADDITVPDLVKILASQTTSKIKFEKDSKKEPTSSLF